MAETRVNNIRKTFNDGQVIAVDNVDLTLEEGELIVLVGPSGCGKSTTLRCIAGLETPNSGSILFGDEDVTAQPPSERDISMVFQNYALYPSMTAYGNMAFGLRMRGHDNETINERVQEAAQIMGIENLLDRYPQQLSGGQMQRVALGRAIVRKPQLFLLDEPLSNLDAKLRSKMRTEIQDLQRSLNVATVFVTHDQAEAMTMGDRIAVMNAGQIEQVGTPEEIYNDPQTLFVADFIGEPGINFFQIEYSGNTLENDLFTLNLPEAVQKRLDDGELTGDDPILAIRPEDIQVNPPSGTLFETEVEVTEFLGEQLILYFTTDGQRKRVVVPEETVVEEGETVRIGFDESNIHIFRPDGPRITNWGDALAEADSLKQ